MIVIINNESDQREDTDQVSDFLIIINNDSTRLNKIHF